MLPTCPLMNGPGYASFFGRGGPTTICGGRTEGTDFVAGVEARETNRGLGGGGRAMVGTDILTRGGGGGRVGEGEGLGEGEEDELGGLARAHCFVFAIFFAKLGDI